MPQFEIRDDQKQNRTKQNRINERLSHNMEFKFFYSKAERLFRQIIFFNLYYIQKSNNFYYIRNANFICTSLTIF